MVLLTDGEALVAGSFNQSVFSSGTRARLQVGGSFYSNTAGSLLEVGSMFFTPSVDCMLAGLLVTAGSMGFVGTSRRALGRMRVEMSGGGVYLPTTPTDAMIGVSNSNYHEFTAVLPTNGKITDGSLWLPSIPTFIPSGVQTTLRMDWGTDQGGSIIVLGATGTVFGFGVK